MFPIFKADLPLKPHIRLLVAGHKAPSVKFRALGFANSRLVAW
jgi:hypothetical protein